MNHETSITAVEPFILHVPVTGNMIQDSTHTVTHWGVVGVRIRTAHGLEGYGYTGTHAHLASDRLITSCISESYGPLLLGEDACDVQRLWAKMYNHAPVQWVGRTGITHIALAAVDTALWDIKAKAAGQPLWRLLGGATVERLEAYNTDGGWLSLSPQAVADSCRRLIEVEGYRGVKIKIGSDNPKADLKRIETVRNAIGADARLAVDCNGRWNLPTMLSVAPHLPDFDLMWVEEPIFYDDLPGHVRLAQSMATPIALGEQLYTLDSFRDFISAGALHWVQPDITRVAGITEWLRVADLALAFHLPVLAHVSDMGQVHVHLAYAHPASTLLEYIPWIKDCFVEPIHVREGYYDLPQQPGAGTTLRPDAFERYAQQTSPR
ncbi:MAG: mandelate racemase/muconate lactonizing enzyme family protein [Spirochaetaceae bacterium]|nr:MAG: mandelate racemase/muconate lactonizing enzyme family protein [Spirochaetaceae bacterium]